MSHSSDFFDNPGNEDRTEGHHSSSPQPRIHNAGSEENTDMRRSGGSANDPHGGHQDIQNEMHSHPADPIEELVPAGHASVPASIQPKQPLESLAFTGTQVPNLPEQLNSFGNEASERSPPNPIHLQFGQPESGSGQSEHLNLAQPGFGPTELDKPTLGEGNPELGLDPSDMPEQLHAQAESSNKKI